MTSVEDQGWIRVRRGTGRSRRSGSPWAVFCSRTQNCCDITFLPPPPSSCHGLSVPRRVQSVIGAALGNGLDHTEGKTVILSVQKIYFLANNVSVFNCQRSIIRWYYSKTMVLIVTKRYFYDDLFLEKVLVTKNTMHSEILAS